MTTTAATTLQVRDIMRSRSNPIGAVYTNKTLGYGGSVRVA